MHAAIQQVAAPALDLKEQQDISEHNQFEGLPCLDRDMAIEPPCPDHWPCPLSLLVVVQCSAHSSQSVLWCRAKARSRGCTYDSRDFHINSSFDGTARVNALEVRRLRQAGPPNNEGSLQGAAEAATPVSHAQSEGTWRDSCNAYKG